MKCTCLLGGTVSQSLPEVMIHYNFFFTPSSLIDHLSFSEKLIGYVKHDLAFINLHWLPDQTVSVQLFPNFILISDSDLS